MEVQPTTVKRNDKCIRTTHDVHPLIVKRWSPRSFSERMISDVQIAEIFEGASLAASAFNEQPWKYVYAKRGSEAFSDMRQCLSAGNQPWTEGAAVLVVSIARKILTRNGKYNAWAEHDVGMANAQLLLQAISKDIYGHCMAGFDKDKISRLLRLSEDEAPICMIALGYLGDPNALEEPYRSREKAHRTRKPLNEFIHEWK